MTQIDVSTATQLADNVPDVAQEQSRDGVRLLHVLGRLSVGEPRRHIELQTERGQVMAERVMEIARDAQALFVTAALSEQRASCQQLAVRACELLARQTLTQRQRCGDEREQLEAAKRAGHRERHAGIEE